MSQILLSEKKYNFKIGYIIKVGTAFYQINGIEPIFHYDVIDSVATVSSADQSFESDLKPNDDYMYWIEKMGIDGALGFQLKFPKTQRWTVHGNKRYIYRHRASFMNPAYMPFLVINPQYPIFTFYNPERSAKEAVMYFEGEKWLTTKLKQSDIEEIIALAGKGKLVYTDLTSYTEKNIGEG